MAIFDWPAGVKLANLEWSQPLVEQLNRSPWTGRSRVVQIGPAARWSATGEFPQALAAGMVVWRGFVFALRGRTNAFRLVAVEQDQHAGTPTVRVNGAATPFDLPLDGLPASTTLLRNGDLVTVRLPSGDEQLIGLGAPLVSNASGQATAALGTPLREPPADNAIVETKRPWALMKSPAGTRWSVDPGAIYSQSFMAEEAF